MNIYNMKLEQFQVNTKFWNTLPPEWSMFVTDVKLVRDLHTNNVDQLHAYLDLGELTKAEIRDLFPEEWLMAISDKNNEPCDLRHYFWDEPFLFKWCADRIIRRCVAKDEAAQILRQCHSRPAGGHHGITTTARKVFEAGFYWPYIFRDARKLVKVCNACQRAGNISSREETPQKYIQVCEIFDV
nr:reverse transcriptase domain-containing protein [Tanacetum cinerariifolium]